MNASERKWTRIKLKWNVYPEWHSFCVWWFTACLLLAQIVDYYVRK